MINRFHIIKPIRAVLFFSTCYLVSWSSALGAGPDVLSGCARIPTTTAGRAFYVDPVRGSMGNDGSSHSPWSTLQDVIAKGLIGNQVYKQPYQQGGQLSSANAGGVIRPGDVLYLRSGNHGDVALRGVNDKFITIEAEPGQKPVIRRLTTYGASKWILRGITFRSDGGGWLVEFLNHNWHGPSDNIVFESNELLSTTDASAWSFQDWQTRGKGGINSYATCAAIRNNRVTNIRHGIRALNDKTLVEGNIIDHFAGDGIDVAASNISVIGNRITNNHGINDDNHNDGIQGWTTKNATNANVLIANNVIINSITPSLRLPGELMGINIFDGKWRNVRVANNCVITNHWHGIAMYGIRDSIVEGNTIAGTDPKKPPWITVTNMKPAQGGAPPHNVIVRNNTAPSFVLPKDQSQVLSQNNQIKSFANPMAAANECKSR